MPGTVLRAFILTLHHEIRMIIILRGIYFRALNDIESKEAEEKEKQCKTLSKKQHTPPKKEKRNRKGIFLVINKVTNLSKRMLANYTM